MIIAIQSQRTGRYCLIDTSTGKFVSYSVNREQAIAQFLWHGFTEGDAEYALANPPTSFERRRLLRIANDLEEAERAR